MKASWMLGETAREARHHARVESVGVFLPEHRVTTRELMARTKHKTRIDLERMTGIREHREAGPHESSLSLATAAARDCLARSRYTGADLDVVIDASITRYVNGGSLVHQFEPPLSLSIKHAIGADAATSFDLTNACAGMLTGVFLLNDMIRRGAIRRGMVVSGERITGLGMNAARRIRSALSPQLASLTLGDGAAAVIVDRCDVPGVLLAGFTTLAEHSRLCLGLPAYSHPGGLMYTRARRIHEVTMTDAPPLIEEILARGGVHLGDVDWLIPHQTSVRAIQSGERVLAQKLGEHPRHVVVTVDELGNTASTTLFIALHHHLTQQLFHRGDKILLLSVASGLEIGVVLLAMDELEATHGGVH
jgi:3-oxoacyl-[acyl-carrier-protein] synthase-3